MYPEIDNLRILALIGAGLLCGCSGTQQEFDRATSPGGEFDLVVLETEPGLPHARHTISVIVIENASGESHTLAVEKMQNDGVPFTSRNIGLRWTSKTTALVCLRPTDIADVGIRINVNGAPSAETRPGC